MKLTSDIHEVGITDIKEAQRMAWDAIPESGRTAFLKFRSNQSCIAKAQSKPLPGAAADAFISKEMRINGRKIFRVFPSHVKALQALDSPLLKMGETATKEKTASGDFNETQQLELCYVFTSEPKELRLKLEKFGVEKLKSEAAEFDGVWDAAEIQATCIAAISQYAKHIQTNVKLIQEAAEGDRFFQDVLEKLSKQPASDSYSTTSVPIESISQPTPAT